MKQIIYRQSNMFIIDRSKLKQNTPNDYVNALYAAIYEEFRGASENPIYADKNNSERMKALNIFAYNWAKSRGLVE